MQNLTEEQQKAIDEATSELITGREYLIAGGAGVGKSFTAVRIMQTLVSKGITRFILTAPTHKATKVLELLLHSAGLSDKAEVSTVHSFLNLRPKINHQTGVRTFEPQRKKAKDLQPDNLSSTLIVCDEAGCLEEQLIHYLFDIDCPKLFLGDRCQLAPVGEEEGWIFDLMRDSVTELSQVIRYTGHILESATYIREHIKNRALNFPKDNDSDEGIFTVSRQYLEKHITALLKDDEFLENRNFFKIGTWRNATMDYWNAFARKILYPEQKERWFPGLRVVALEPCSDMKKEETPFGKEYWTYEKLISASMEADIKEVSVGRAAYGEYFSSTHRGYPPAFKCYFLDCINELGQEVTIRVIHEDDEQKLADYLQTLIMTKQWKLFYDVKDYFHNVGDAFSMTVRRLQGSTVKYMFIDRADVNACPKSYDRNRMWYVLITRAQKRVYL